MARYRFLLFLPALVDGGAHVVSLSREQVESCCCHMVMDLRRVVHPPFVTFWTTKTVTQFSVGHLEEILQAEFSSVAPLMFSLMTFELRRFPLITVMGIPSDSRHLGCMPEPALHFTRDLLMARPGIGPAIEAASHLTTTTTGMEAAPQGVLGP